MRVHWVLLSLLLAYATAADSNSTELDTFLKWFTSKGGRFNAKVTPRVLKPGSLGVVTVGALPVNQEVVSVPVSLLINPFLSDSEGFSDREVLAIKLAIEAANVSQSLWGPYLRLLPVAPLDSALYFTQEDADELRNTYALHVAVDIKAALSDFEARLKQSRYSWILGQQSGFWGRGGLLKWAVSTVNARAYVIIKPTNPDHPYHDRPFLAPGADLFNHNPVAQVGWRLGVSKVAPATEGESFQIHTRQSYEAAGLEVFNHYRDLSNPYLLAFYGFAIDNNPHDSLPIRLSLPAASAPSASLKQRFLRALNITVAQQLARSGISVSLLNLVRVLALPDGSLYEGGLKILMDANMNATRSPQDGVVSVSDSGQVTFDVQYPTSVDDGLPGFNASTQHLIVPKVTEDAAIHMLLRALTSLSDGYPTQLVVDRTRLAASDGTLARPPTSSKSSRGAQQGHLQAQDHPALQPPVLEQDKLTPKQRAVLICRISEKEILVHAITWLKVQLGLLPPPTNMETVLPSYSAPGVQDTDLLAGEETESADVTLNTEHEGADHVVNREGTLHAVDDTAGLAAQPVEEGEDPKSPK